MDVKIFNLQKYQQANNFNNLNKYNYDGYYFCD